MRHRRLMLGIALCAAGAALAQFNPSHIPEQATWFAVLDVKALRESAAGGLAVQMLDEAALRQLAGIHAMTGLNLTNDIDTVALYGRGNAQTNAVLSFYGRFDPGRISAVLGAWALADFSNRAVGERSLLSWDDHGARANLCFVDPTHLVVSRNDAELLAALKHLDRPAAPNAAFEAALAPATNRFFVAQLNNVADFVADNQQLVILNGTDSLVLDLRTVSEEEGGVEGALALRVGSVEQAAQLQQILMGLQAILLMQAKENPDAAALARQVKIDRHEQLVKLNLKLTQQTLKQMIANEVAKRRAGAGAAPEPAPPNPRPDF